MFARLVITLAVLVAVVVFVRRQRARRVRDAGQPTVNARTLRCAHCAVYFPESEAVHRHGLSFCTSAHADAAARRD